MSLSARLRPIDLRLECKHCGHPLIKNGAWFMTVAHFRCERCKREVTVTYSDKVALFDKHAPSIVEGTALGSRGDTAFQSRKEEERLRP